MSEPTRPIHQPTVERDGSLVAHTVATPVAFKVRARVTIGSRKVIPVIFVPGSMGSNLRARADSNKRDDDALRPGEPAWRPPNHLAGKPYCETHVAVAFQPMSARRDRRAGGR